MKQLMISLIILIILFIGLGLFLLIDEFVVDSRLGKSFTDLDPPIIVPATSSINGPFSSNLGFGSSLSGNKELSQFIVGVPQDNLNIGSIQRYTQTNNDSSGYEHTLEINPTTVDTDEFGTTINMSYNAKWITVCAASRLYILDVSKLLPGVPVEDHLTIPTTVLLSNAIYVRVSPLDDEIDNIFVQGDDTVYQIRKFGKSPNFAWNYQVSLFDGEIPLFGQYSQFMTSSGTSLHGNDLEQLSNPSSSVWSQSWTLPAPDSVTVWGDVVAISWNNLFGVVHAIESGLDVVYIIYRTLASDIWNINPTPLTGGTSFGTSLACSETGAYVVIGEPLATVDTLSERGAVYIYTKTGVELGDVEELEPISGNQTELHFGTQVLISQSESESMTVLASGPDGTVSFPGIVCSYTLN